MTGLTIARYTGDTKSSPEEALNDYRFLTKREKPYSCELLSRKEIQDNPPDILMTNYVMLELLLTRFETAPFSGTRACCIPGAG